MITRYTTQEMSDIWSDENKLRKWLDVELAVCRAYNVSGRIPDRDYRIIVKKADFDINRVNEIEKTVKHDVIAFLTSVSEFVGPSSRFIHMGMTSSDMLDTANALIMKQSARLLQSALKGLKKEIIKKARKYSHSPIVGRTHGVHAEPTTVGLKMLVWADDIERCIGLFELAEENVSRGKLSGAVGNYAHITPAIEKKALSYLKLKPARISSQIISRDVYSDYIYASARAGSIIDKIAVQIRLLQRTETREFEEPFGKGQKGSSAMPHKRNPVQCEQMSGLSRILRSNLQASLENIALWDERDISHSSVERVIMADSSILLHYMLEKTTAIVRDMNVYEKKCKENYSASFNLVFSQKVLLALIGMGMTREDAYAVVQENAMKAWKGSRDFRELISNDRRITGLLGEKDIDRLFDPSEFNRHVDDIFRRFRN